MFLICVPTIRPDICETREALFTSLSQPTDTMILDGSEGLAQTYNRALSYIDRQRHAIFAKLDDDLLLPFGWQDTILAAFEDVPHLGAVGLDLAHTQEGREYMVVVPELLPYGRVQFRELKQGNITGILICMRASLALEIGPVPIVAGTTYQVYEDGWRCARAVQCGYKIGYVLHDPPARLYHYADSDEYKDKKQLDIRNARAHSSLWSV